MGIPWNTCLYQSHTDDRPAAPVHLSLHFNLTLSRIPGERVSSELAQSRVKDGNKHDQAGKSHLCHTGWQYPLRFLHSAIALGVGALPRKKVPRSTSFRVRALTWWVGWRRGAPGQSPSHKSSGTPWMPRTAAAHLAGHLPPQAGERCHQCIGRKQCPGQHPNQLQPSQWRSQRQWRTKQGSTRSPHQQMLPVVSPRWPRSKPLRFQCLQ